MTPAKDRRLPSRAIMRAGPHPRNLHPNFTSQPFRHSQVKLLFPAARLRSRAGNCGKPFRAAPRAIYSAMASQQETEVKLRVDDLAALIRKLKRVGARCHGRILEKNTLFDTPDSDFRHRGRLLRLRIETPARSPLIAAGRAQAWLTSKQPAPASAPAGYKQNLESEASVRAPKYSIARFRALGFRPAFRYEKFRSR